tara:strand:- start:18252 stop:19262 length:1011 start_codon:yes stop_codon:yes gene_type:complete
MYNIKYHNINIKEKTFLVTGGAGFIGSNLVEYLVKWNAKKIRILDNFLTGHIHNVESFLDLDNVELIDGDIRDLSICNMACKDVDYVLHQAALGSVPRSIIDPQTTNDINITGFLNMLIASRDNNIKRFVYAASSSTYGDSKKLPKIENEIGNPLSPYAITKYVNELYADIFNKSYDLECVGLRYFNVFGQRQDPNGAYAAVIPLFIKQLIKLDSVQINGDGFYSRDFTYIDNVVQINMLAISSRIDNDINQVYNTACGNQTNLTELALILKSKLSFLDKKIENNKIIYGPFRDGDIPHSLASIEKAKKYLNYNPNYSFEEGIDEAIIWYYKNLKS